MKKQEIEFEVPQTLSWTYGVDIGQIRKDLDALEKLGASRVDIEAYENYGSPTVVIKAFGRRMETDDEFKERKRKEKQKAEDQRQWDLKQFEKLKAKLGK